MKHMKKQLVGAVAMLVVAAVMLTSVSYAWFTLSTNPEVKGMKASVAANENLEIALDNGYADEDDVNEASQLSQTDTTQGYATGNPYTWGNLVDLGVAMATMNQASGTTDAPKLILAPVKYDTTGKKLQYPKYGDDGRVSTVADLTSKVVTDVTNKTVSGGVHGYRQANTSTVYDAFSVTYWLRSNEDCAVSLTADGVKRAGSKNDSAASTDDVNGAEGLGSYIQIPVSGENTADRVKAYAKHIVVQLNVGDETPIYAKLDAGTDVTTKVEGVDTVTSVKFKLTLNDVKTSANDTTTDATTISLIANTAKKITMYVYVDGATLTNADALLDDIGQIDLNVQFASNEINSATDTTGPGAMNGTTVSATGGGN